MKCLYTSCLYTLWVYEYDSYRIQQCELTRIVFSFNLPFQSKYCRICVECSCRFMNLHTCCMPGANIFLYRKFLLAYKNPFSEQIYLNHLNVLLFECMMCIFIRIRFIVLVSDILCWSITRFLSPAHARGQRKEKIYIGSGTKMVDVFRCIAQLTKWPNGN